ncbi:MAG: hypothetical protein ACK4ST_00480, partial [Elioraea tepidiphila]
MHLDACRLKVHRWPWGATGLDFNGQSLFSVHAKAEARTVVLIDEIDRADPEFEAFLLEFFADFQVSIPEIGTI